MDLKGDTAKIHVGPPVEYFFVDGEAARVIDKAVDLWLENLLSGKPMQWTKTEQLAKGMSGPSRQTSGGTSGPVLNQPQHNPRNPPRQGPPPRRRLAWGAGVRPGFAHRPG